MFLGLYDECVSGVSICPSVFLGFIFVLLSL